MQPDHSDPERWKVAVHEAGHAVAAWHFGFALGVVTIVPEVGFDGSATFSNPFRGWQRGDGSRRQLAMNCAVASYSGLEAEAALCGTRTTESTIDEGGAYQDLRLYCREMAWDDGEERLIRGLRARALKLMREHAHRVEAVALSLYEHGSLPPERVIEIILAAGG